MTPNPYIIPTAGSVAAFCDALSIGQTTFYKHVKLGNIKIMKIGKKTLVRTSEREAFLARVAGVPSTNTDTTVSTKRGPGRTKSLPSARGV